MKLIAAFQKLFKMQKFEIKENSPTCLHVENFLDTDFFNQLNSDWLLHRKKWNNSKLQSNLNHSRIDIQRGDFELDALCKDSNAWKDFVDDSNSEELFQTMFLNNYKIFEEHGLLKFEKLKFNPKSSDFYTFSNQFWPKVVRKLEKHLKLKSFYNKIRFNLSSHCEVFSICNLAESSQGYTVPPHTDNAYKVIVGLLYFDEVRHGGDLVLHHLKEQMPVSQMPRQPSEALLNQSGKIVPKPNSLVLLVNSNNAFHSVTSYSGELRRFVYVGFGLKHLKSAWK
jgi:hypothetical protein